MKAYLAASLLLITGFAANAHAQCVTQKVTNPSSVVANKLVCAHKGTPANPGARWSELHQRSGTLTEWARGAGDPVDPSHDVGSWSVNRSTGVLTYAYTGDGSYSYQLFDDGGGKYSLCTAQNGTVEATIKKVVANPSGNNPCGWQN